MTLPPNAAFQMITGPLCRTSHLSKQLVCLEACKKLHEAGALSDHLLPLNEESMEIDSTMKSKELYAGAGKCMYMYRILVCVCICIEFWSFEIL